MYNISNLHDEFPGGYRKSPNNYQYYMVGDIFLAQQLNINLSISSQLEKASIALGKFSAQIEKIPNPNGYIRAFTNSEANQSSRIEGTQTNIEDAYKKEEDISVEKKDDWQEVQSYIQALNHGIKQLEQLPLCNRLIKQTHKILLSQVRGKNKLPGAFRKSQNWIGGSRPDNAHFVPPSAEYVADAMSNLEKFIQDEQTAMPHLIKVALIHYQFETIHPFLDGNGRIGRMLISLYLLEKGILKHPILYISQFFESNRKDYYFMLDNARKNQASVIKWISFFLDGVIQTAEQGIQKTESLIALKAELSQKIIGLGRKAKNAQKLLDLLFEQPIIRSKDLTEALEISAQSCQTLVREFVKMKILREITGYKRNRIFIFASYLDLLYLND